MNTHVTVFGSERLHDGGFAYGARVDADAMILTAGLSPLDGDGQVVGPDDPVIQVRQILACLDTLLGEHGTDRSAVARLTGYVATADRQVLADVWHALDTAFGGAAPPAMLAGVTVLPYPGQVVEFDAVVAVGPSR